jgi:hypothetical protein
VLGLISAKLATVKILDAPDVTKPQNWKWFVPGGFLGDIITKFAGPTGSLSAAGDTLFSAENPQGVSLASDTPVDLGGISGNVQTQGSVSDVFSGNLYTFNLNSTGRVGDSITVTFAPGTNVDLIVLDQRGGYIGGLRGDSGTLSIGLQNLPAGAYQIGIAADLDQFANLPYTLSISGPATDLPNLNGMVQIGVNTDTVYAGQKVPVTWTVRNTGAQASTPTSARLVWSRDEVIDDNDANFVDPTTLVVPALQPGESYSQTVLVTMPKTHLGTLHIGIVADRLGAVVESSESDNAGVMMVELGLAPDRLESNDRPSTAEDLGGLVKNIVLSDLAISSSDDSDWFRLYLPTTGTASDFAQLAVNTLGGSAVNLKIELYNDDLERIGEVTELGRLSMNGLAAGTYFLRVASEGGLPAGYDLLVNSAARSGADLVVKDLLMSSLLRPTLDSPAEVTVANHGSATAHDVLVRLVASDNGTNYVIDTLTLDALKAGEIKTLEMTANLPAALAGKTGLSFRVEIDPANTVPEINETIGNTLTVTVNATRLPDANEAVERSEGFIDLGPVRGQVNVSGNIDSFADSDVFRFVLISPGTAGHRIDLSFLNAQGDLDLLLFNNAGEQVEVSIGAGDGETISLDGLPEGQYMAWVRTQTNGSTGNPAYTLTLHAPDVAGPNLIVDDLVPSSQFLQSGGTVDVTTTLANIGNQASGGFAIRYYISEDPVIDASDTPLTGAIALASLNGESSVVDARTLQLPANLAGGIRYIGVLVDSNQQVAEVGESDNQGALTFAILPQADVLEPNNTTDLATQAVFVNNKYIADNLTLTQGDVDVYRFTLTSTASFTDYAQVDYTSNEGEIELIVLDALGNELRSGVQTRLEDGRASVDVTFAGLPAGDYYVIVRNTQAQDFSSSYRIEIDPIGSESGSSAFALPLDSPQYDPVSNTAPGDGQVTPPTQPVIPAPTPALILGELIDEEPLMQTVSAGDVLPEATPLQIVNGSFGIADPQSPQFGWTLAGAASVQAGHAVLGEGDSLISRFTQTFQVPVGATALQFTVTDVSLNAILGLPGDAFEVALLGDNLDALTPTVSLAGSDALLNLQPDGTLTLADGVQASASGFDGPVTFTIDLTGVTPGTIATVYFDLISFAPQSSSVSFDNVIILTEGVVGPDADDDSAQVNEDESVVIDVLGNDTAGDAAINPASVIIVADPQHGSVTVDPETGAVTYTPDENYFGDDSFTYQVLDSSGVASNVAAVNVTVNSVNDNPVAVDDDYQTDEDTALVIDAAAGVLDNDSDLESESLVVSALDDSQTLGTVTLNDDGSFTYIPPQNFSGIDTFAYTVSDGQGGFATATVRVTVNAVNDAPTLAVPGSQNVQQPNVLPITGISVSDVDAGSGELTVTLSVVHGSITLGGITGLSFTDGDGSGDAAMTFRGTLSAINAALAGLTYQPANGYEGGDSLNLTVNDGGNTGAGGALQAQAAVAINVTAPPATPVQVSAFTVNEGGAQRSNIRFLTVKFDSDTNLQALITAGTIAQAITLQGPGGPVTLSTADFTYNAATRTLTVKLTQSGKFITRLTDGRYTLRLNTDLVRRADGRAGLADTDGTANGVMALAFHRLLGDFDGNAVVNNADLTLFNQRYRSQTGQAKYNQDYDFNGDGAINLSDLALMQKQANKRV